MKIAVMTTWSPLEIPYMKEFVEYHKSLGVSEFIVTLNDWSAFDMVEFNKCFWREMNDNTIHPLRIDGPSVLIPSFNKMLDMAGKMDIDWIAGLDADEFIKIRSDRSLEEILSDFKDYPQLSLNWRLYGSNGIDEVRSAEADNFSVLTRFTKCEKVLNRHVKQLVNLSWFRSRGAMLPQFMLTHNTNAASKGLLGEMVIGPWNYWKLDIPREIELAHYAVKSRQECQTRREFRRGDMPIPREEGWLNFFNEHNKNDIAESEIHYTR